MSLSVMTLWTIVESLLALVDLKKYIVFLINNVAPRVFIYDG